MICLPISHTNQSWRVRSTQRNLFHTIKKRKNCRIMTFGLESMGLAGWIFVILILLVCCSAFIMCCFEREDDFMTSSHIRNLQKPYDPRADGVVDMGPMLFLNHFYNSAYSGHHATYDLSGGIGIGDAGDFGHYGDSCGDYGGGD